MSLSAGSRLGPYEILSALGAGGMGEVWKARDTRLDRIVAIKTSNTEFSERFETEARAVAALNHPHICQLYDVGPNYLVMEFVEGTALKGPLPLDQALAIAIQLADALDAAHKKGITHRDLKPANTLLTKSGVKVLDFGLAKVARARGVAASEDVTRAGTVQGTILGTWQYMAPEQLQAKEDVDCRADIFSFGCVLYEMLTGKRAFDGGSTASIIAAILERPAPSVAEIAPAALDRLLKTCLAKDPDDRWQSARDLKRELEWIAAGGGTEVPRQAKARPTWIWWTSAAMVALGAAAILAFVHFREKPAEAPLVRFSIAAPEKGRLSAYPIPSISPDGRKIAFSAVGADGQPRIFLRSLDSTASQPIAGTESGYPNCWSPDGKSLAFSANGKLARIDPAGGAALALTDAPLLRGCAWNRQDTIVFLSRFGPIYRISASGGAAAPITKLDYAEGETAHFDPDFLPDGKHFLYAARKAASTTIRVASLDSPGESRSLLDADSSAAYAQGYLLYLRGNTLMARPFDANRLEFTGEEGQAAAQVRSETDYYHTFSVSSGGWLVYAGGASAGDQLTWFDHAGKRLGTLGDAGILGVMHFSPDRKRVAVTATESSAGGASDIWIYDVLRGLRTRFTFDPADDSAAVWSPDGRTILFSSARKGPGDIYRKPADGSANEELLYADKLNKQPTSLSPDGRYLAYAARGDPQTGYDIWILPEPLGKAGASKPYPFVRTSFSELNPQFSPDGKWIAYQSDESGRMEIYVAPFPGPGGKKQVSAAGGVMPRWRADGRELFFIAADQKLMAAEVNAKPGVFEVGGIRALFGPLVTGRGFLYDVSADGQRFLAVVPPEGAAEEPLTVVGNWTAALKK